MLDYIYTFKSGLQLVKYFSMDEIILVKESINLSELKKLANKRGNNLVKAVVDVENTIMAIDAEMHADEEKLLLEQGSLQTNLWGINIYPENPKEKWVEFDSMINVRSKHGNRSRGIEDPNTQQKIIEIVNSLIKE